MNHLIEILNLKCGGCANSIKKALSPINEIEEVRVDENLSTVSFKSTGNPNIESEIRKVLTSLGYPPIDQDNSAFLKGKSFVSCLRGRFA